MVLTARTRTTLFNAATSAPSSAKTLIRLPLSVVPHYEQRCEITGAIVPVTNKPLFRPNLWSSDEHERFLHGLEMFPNGPWKEVAKIVGTKTTRQTMTHGQKYRQKIERHMAKSPKKAAQTSRRQGLHRTTAQVKDKERFGHSVLGVRADIKKGPLVHDPPATVATPARVNSTAFGEQFVDHEFDALLNALEASLFYQANCDAPTSCSDNYHHSFYPQRW